MREEKSGTVGTDFMGVVKSERQTTVMKWPNNSQLFWREYLIKTQGIESKGLFETVQKEYGFEEEGLLNTEQLSNFLELWSNPWNYLQFHLFSSQLNLHRILSAEDMKIVKCIKNICYQKL